MHIKEKTKDNLNTHRDLNNLLNRPELEFDERRPNVMPKAAYTLSKEQKRRVCEWIKGLQFPDGGYASKLACCVDMTELQMHGMKSHDFHVFIQKLIPIAFQKTLPEHLWSALTEVSLLFQNICSTTLDVYKFHELKNNVAIILCNLEKIFPPAFFDSMEHIIVHLPYEALIGGLVQYRWMYPFERFMSELKKKAKNKTHVEASIVEVYIIKEIDLFTSQYFESGVQSKRTMPRRNMSARTMTMAFRCRFSTTLVHPMLNSIENELLKSHYWGRSAEVTSVPCYFVNGYNFKTERHNTGKSTKNRGYPSLKRDKADWFVVAKVKARRVVDESKWTEICAYQPDEVLPVPVVSTNNQTYDLHDPNGLQVMIDNQAAGTSRSQARQTDDDNEEDAEESFKDDDTDDDEYELT
ncbi:UNVERIFIED_CONTAM: hypothetical protein Sradi_1565500 [Sesamum radiatum]|uniref:DUF4218 domain-containing protein n=1 Tax=Sesamum radiatum TaxID=300843 RepID=A0AAW2U921_SESRA